MPIKLETNELFVNICFDGKQMSLQEERIYMGQINKRSYSIELNVQKK